MIGYVGDRYVAVCLDPAGNKHRFDLDPSPDNPASRAIALQTAKQLTRELHERTPPPAPAPQQIPPAPPVVDPARFQALEQRVAQLERLVDEMCAGSVEQSTGDGSSHRESP